MSNSTDEIAIKTPNALAKLLRRAAEDFEWNIDEEKRQRLALLANAWSEISPALPKRKQRLVHQLGSVPAEIFVGPNSY